MPQPSPLTLCDGFLQSAERLPDAPALEVDGERLSYGALRALATSLAATLEREAQRADPPLTGVFASRSVTAFAGVLAALLRGHGYVPLNPKFPAERSRVMLERAGCGALVVDRGATARLDELLDGIERPLLIVLPDAEDVTEHAARWPLHRFVGVAGLADASAWRPRPADPDAIAYLLFTSGSTGTPKGVMVAHRNARSFIDVMVARYGITEADRLSQTFDLTFDLSVFDMFVAWEGGACVCCPPEHVLMTPGRFIRDARLTLWFSVPSTAVFMRKLKMLKPGSYPGLRLSLFCGEPLPAESARAWSAAAPSSVLENLYGPTELTIACTAYRGTPRAPRPSRPSGSSPSATPIPA